MRWPGARLAARVLLGCFPEVRLREIPDEPHNPLRRGELAGPEARRRGGALRLRSLRDGLEHLLARRRCERGVGWFVAKRGRRRGEVRLENPWRLRVRRSRRGAVRCPRGVARLCPPAPLSGAAPRARRAPPPPRSPPPPAHLRHSCNTVEPSVSLIQLQAAALNGTQRRSAARAGERGNAAAAASRLRAPRQLR